MNRIKKIVGFLLKKLVKYVGCLAKIKSCIYIKFISLPSSGFLEVLVRHNVESDFFFFLILFCH